MPTWGNNDAANSKPLFPVEREVREVTILTTANSTTSGNTIVFSTAIPSSVQAGAFVYSLIDANANAVSRMYDGSFVDQNDIAFYRSNNTVKTVVDAANGIVRFANTFSGTIAGNTQVYFANSIVYNNPLGANLSNDTVLVTATRATSANNLIGGNVNQGWNYVTKKTNNDGTVRYLRETLIALANPTASNTASGNTSWGQAFANT